MKLTKQKGVYQLIFWVVVFVLIVLFALRHGLPQRKKKPPLKMIYDDLECCYSESELKELQIYRKSLHLQSHEENIEKN